MKHLVEFLAAVTIISTWLAGFVLASGFWSTVARLFPPYAWYLVVAHAMRSAGIA